MCVTHAEKGRQLRETLAATGDLLVEVIKKITVIVVRDEEHESMKVFMKPAALVTDEEFYVASRDSGAPDQWYLDHGYESFTYVDYDVITNDEHTYLLNSEWEWVQRRKEGLHS